MLSQRQVIVLFVGWWLVWLVIQAVAIVLVGIQWPIAILDSAVSMLFLAFESYSINNIIRFYRPGGRNAIYVLTWSAAISGIGIAIIAWLLPFIFAGNEVYRAFMHTSVLVRFSFAFIMIAFSAALSWVWYFMQQQQRDQQRQTDAEKLAREAELSSLRQQLQPHFLFNSLNSINALITIDPVKAQEMIHQLSDFFRSTLRKDEQQKVPFEEEVRQIGLYLDIEKVRFGHRLKTISEISEESKKLSLPSLLLQPVVENAIKFGLYDTTGEVTIHIRAAKEGNNLVIDVDNPYDPETSSPRKGSGFGLSSIQRRLYLEYARNDLLTTKQQDGIFTTHVLIPQNE